MYPILYENITAGIVPQNNGIGVLSDCVSCTVEQERNGIYELTMQYQAAGIHASEIAERRILKVKPNFTDNAQLFRIDKVGKVINGKFTVYAKHISYDLSGYPITSGEAETAAAACQLLEGAANGYTITTDKTTAGNFKIKEPSSVRSWFAGKEGSFLDVFGTAELKYDNFHVSFLLHAGSDRGAVIRYGKNLLELSQELDCSNLCTAVICFWKSSEGTVVTGDQVNTGLTLDVPRVRVIDCSAEYQEAPTAAALTQRAERFIENNNLVTPKNNIKLNFAQSEELSNRVDLCDEVTIYYEALGISGKTKCIKVKWDCIREKYIETEFGDVSANIADTFVEAIKAIEEKPSKTFLAEAVDRATKLITGNLGGYVILHDSNGDGEPDEILIMDTADINTATKVWRWNKRGLGYSDTGYDGEYGLAMTSEGEIAADFITTGVLNANLIKAGTITDVAGNSSIDMTNGVAIMKNFKAKNALDFIDENGILRGNFWYDATNGCNLEIKDPSGNTMVWLTSDNLGGSVYLTNHNKKESVELTVDGNNAGVVYVCNSSGTDKIDLYGYSGHIWCVAVDQGSSRKIKKNIKPIEDAQKILELQAVSFDYKEEEMGTDKRGFIAEDVAEILPNLVTPEGDKPASLDYIGMIPYLQQVVKDQAEKIKALEDKLEKLL